MPKNEFQQSTEYLSSRLNVAKPHKTIDYDYRQADLEAVQEHTQFYSDYLKTFVDEYKQKSHSQRIMKKCFFVVTLILLAIIMGGGVTATVIISLKQDITPSDVATVITAVVGAVSSFLILPKVIAENLFPSREEDKTAEIFGIMFEYDNGIRNIYNANSQQDAEI